MASSPASLRDRLAWSDIRSVRRRVRDKDEKMWFEQRERPPLASRHPFVARDDLCDAPANIASPGRIFHRYYFL